MCGIAGFFTLRPNDPRVWTVFDAQFAATEARGREGSGVFSLPSERGGSIYVHRQNLPASELIGVAHYRRIKNTRPTAVVGHCRLPTKGLSTNPANLHPILAGKVLGVHNGIVRNDEELFRRFGLPRAGQVDSEVIFRLIERFCPEGLDAAGVRRAFAEIRGDYALAFTHARTLGEVWLARNEWRPLVLVWLPALETLYFGSERRFIFGAMNRAMAATGDGSLSKGLRVWDLPAGMVAVVDRGALRALSKGKEWGGALRMFRVPAAVEGRLRAMPLWEAARVPW